MPKTMVNKVLFLMEKYCDADPKCGPTNSESQLVGAIESTGLVKETKHFYFDVLCQQFGKNRMGELLLEDCQVFQPDLVIYTPLGGVLGYQLNPSDEALGQIRVRGIKLYSVLWDTEGGEWSTWSRWVPSADGVLIMDTIIRAEYYRGDPRIIQAYSAIDPRDFYNKGLLRDLDVSFIGAVDSTGIRWPGRIQHINFLRNNGINVFVAGGQRQNRISWEEYSNFLNRTKISLSFTVTDIMSRTLDGQLMPRRTSQLKGRVFETLSCGALLMEDNGMQTKEFFEPGKDYVVFHNERDLLDKIRYFLAHDAERQTIAQSGCKKVTRVYNARNMWGHLFAKMGFKVPDENFKRHEEVMGCS